MADDIAIKVENVSKNFLLPHQKVNSVKSLFTTMLRRDGTIETQHALKNIDLEIKKGEFFGIVGRNGSGKSTLLKILAGIYQPTKGKVQVHGKLVPFIELGVGFNPELTGRENVYLNGALLGFSEKEVAAMYDDIVEFAELEKFMDQKLKNYSSGMQVRLAFSMATRSQADILLIDEVLAVGDADFQRKCFNYFKTLKKLNKTVILVSHDMDAVREYCDRAALIENASLTAIGESDNISSAYIKLFNEKSEKGSVQVPNKGANRWGNEEVIISRARVAKTRLTDTTDQLAFSVDIMAKTKTDNLLAGFIIKNASGAAIVGSNNKILKKHLSMNEGEGTTITWRVPNIFSDGRHHITIALESEANVCDWWDDALSFEVYREAKTPYPISPHVELELTNEKVSNAQQ